MVGFAVHLILHSLSSPRKITVVPDSFFSSVTGSLASPPVTSKVKVAPTEDFELSKVSVTRGMSFGKQV